jgi:DNA-binding GntR family transcriptional regulator
LTNRRTKAGQLVVGAQLPTVRELAETNNVSVSTVKRGLTLLVEWGLIEVSRGRRATVRQPQEHLE